jgi:hypothetical protein
MPRPKTAAAEYERLTLRLPKDVAQALREQADAIGRSINTHALYVLRYGLGLVDQEPMSGVDHHASRRSSKH